MRALNRVAARLARAGPRYSPGFAGIRSHKRWTGIDRFVVLKECDHPAENSLPTFAVTGEAWQIAGESAVSELHRGAGAHFLRAARLEAMNFAGRQFPAHQRISSGAVAGYPGMNQSPGRIDFQILAVHAERCAVGAHPHT